MKIQFCGAAGTVTGSCHLFTGPGGEKILLDCGLYQGNDPDFDKFNREWPFNPSDIDVLVLSHAHIDHSGRIPKLVKDGFKGDIICTSATRDLCAIMLLDSAYIQEKEIEYENRDRKRSGFPPLDPLYEVADVPKAMSLFTGIPYNKWFRIAKHIEVILLDSGHILGSASVTLRIEHEDQRFSMIGFSGDIGRPQRPILRDPVPMPDLDYLICESTYGGEKHKDAVQDEDDLLYTIEDACAKRKGKLIIPAFSVGRTQEIVYMLDRLESSGKLPKIPVYIDSPMATDATGIFILHPECYDREILNYMRKNSDPFVFKNLHYTQSVEESKAINFVKGPCIIVSASGMMQAGRVKHHLSNFIEDHSTTILIVGFCAQGTLGRKIRDGADVVRIYGKDKKVNAKVFIMDSFSAHGDQDEMLDYLRPLDKNKLKKVFLVHGENDRQLLFRDALLKEGIKEVEIPELGDIAILE